MSKSSFIQDVTSIRNAVVPNVVVRETEVGYDVRTESSIGDRAVLIEQVSATAGLALIVVAVTSIAMGWAHAIPSLGAAQMAMGAIVLTGGVAYLWISIRGMRHQVNFDLKQRQMHIAVRNHMDGYRVLRTIGFDRIESAFIKRPAGPGKPATLYARLGDSDDLIEIARGPLTTLRHLHGRLSHDLPGRAPDTPPSKDQGPRTARRSAKVA